jgi:hypothetical protein
MRDRAPVQILDWVNRTDKAVAALLPLHAAMRDLPGHPRHKRALMSLSTACLGSTGTVLHLAEVLRLWDAELVLRSVIEGSVKFAYLLEKRETFTARCIEYCDALPAIGWLRRHARAQDSLNALSGDEDRDERPFRDLLLSDEDLTDLRAAYPRRMRSDIERRWGFTALVEAVAKQGGAIGPMARALLHGYSVASDLQHMSHIGTELPLERDMRPDDRRHAIELAHAAKLISDCYHFTVFRVIVILRFLGRSFGELSQVKAKYEPLMDELKRLEKDWEALEYGPRPTIERKTG